MARSKIMASFSRNLTKTFIQFFSSEKASGSILIFCTIASLLIANSTLGTSYLHAWHMPIAGLSVEQWINDALMAIFFLLIGLELKHELYVGALSNIRSALLPVIAALGGVCVPASIHFIFNAGTATQAGIGIPMATDIAFALGVLALLGTRIPASLKIFLAALAVIDDLVAIIVIAIFYTAELSLMYLSGAILVFFTLILLNRLLKVTALTPYLMGGALMWYLMLQSGIHATIAGVLLACTIPFNARVAGKISPCDVLEHILHKPVTFIILPIFALANTGIIIESDWAQQLTTANSTGIMLGLVLGKPIGITLVCFVAVALGLCRLPSDLTWKHIFGAGLLGGIGFTMSIFITNLAFSGDTDEIVSSKIAVLLASLIAGIAGYLWLRFLTPPSLSLAANENSDEKFIR